MAEPLLQISYSLSEIQDAAYHFWQCAYEYNVWAFNAEMGAGKTTFIHALCDHLGVQDAVSSPTFAIINEYHFLKEGADTILYHMDWYRLRDEEEGRNAGVEDCLEQPNAYSAVEWPTNAPGLLAMPHLQVTIEVEGGGRRRVTVIANG